MLSGAHFFADGATGGSTAIRQGAVGEAIGPARPEATQKLGIFSLFPHYCWHELVHGPIKGGVDQAFQFGRVWFVSRDGIKGGWIDRLDALGRQNLKALQRWACQQLADRIGQGFELIERPLRLLLRGQLLKEGPIGLPARRLAGLGLMGQLG